MKPFYTFLFSLFFIPVLLSQVQTIQNTNNTLNIANPNGPITTINLKVPLTLTSSVIAPNHVFTAKARGTGGGISGTGTNGVGVSGKSTNGLGLQGESVSNFGVFGKSRNSIGIYGESENLYGVYGFSLDNTGVFGQSNNWNGVQGFSNNGIGIYGESIEFPGVWGMSQNLMGVFGYTQSKFQFAIVGQNANTPDHFGALGGVVLPSGFGIGVYGAASDNAKEWAGLFEGNVNISGNCLITEDFIVIGSKSFQIDHPSNPENKYLIHSCVESPERMNIYNGNIVTNGDGFAIVELPGYFDVLNINYRYQLTVIGQFAQAIVESKIQNNRFTIKTDKPNVEVSWQVTGVRNDPYAKNHPLIVEKEKRGTIVGNILILNFLENLKRWVFIM